MRKAQRSPETLTGLRAWSLSLGLLSSSALGAQTGSWVCSTLVVEWESLRTFLTVFQPQMTEACRLGCCWELSGTSKSEARNKVLPLVNLSKSSGVGFDLVTWSWLAYKLKRIWDWISGFDLSIVSCNSDTIGFFQTRFIRYVAFLCSRRHTILPYILPLHFRLL